jgi:ribosome maturation factor RimP
LFLKKTNVASEVEALLRPVVEGLGYDLWDVVYRKVGADWTLTITIDSENGISIDDCEKVHRTIDPILDEAGPIEDSYQLEVSSPGIEREIRTDAHIAACMGEEIDARLFAPHEGKRAYTGILANYEGNIVTLQTAEGTVSLPRAAISHMNTTYQE